MIPNIISKPNNSASKNNSCNVIGNTMSSGMQSKFYEPSTDMWYKQDYLGHEGLAEYVASRLLEGSGVPHVLYEPCRFMMGNKEVTGCCSQNFLAPGERLVSTYELLEKELGIDIADETAQIPDVKDRIYNFVEKVVEVSGCKEFGSYLTAMLRLDAFTKNDDRHFNNISLIQDRDGNYRPAPIYDNGAAFLSDQYSYGENYNETQVIHEMDGVLAKPFSTDFDEQLDACESLYPSDFKLNKDVYLDEGLMHSLYKAHEVDTVMEVLAQSKRKYSYMLAEEKDKGAER